jgi:thiamine pyrophosphate-dependent acetolactate synthase large subunit-like protein
VAEAFGADGKVCETASEVETAIASAWSNRRLTVIQAIVDAGPYRV